jgi:hypothetical protein
MNDLENTADENKTIQSSQPIYQTSILNPGVIQNLIHDDSPIVVGDEFWEFLGVEIPVSDIKDYDFHTILTLVEERFLDILEKYPESEWDKVQVVQYGNRVVEKETIEDGQKVIHRTVERVPARIYNLLELWKQIHIKVRLKMYRAREGFTLDRLTTTRSFVKEESNLPQMGMPYEQKGMEENKGWKLF